MGELLPLPRPAVRKGHKIRQLGQYSLDGLLGKGTFGRVYQAHGPEGLVALKIQHISAENIAALAKEVEVQRTIAHPSFVCLHGSFTARYRRKSGATDNVFCIVQELCEGGDLAWVMRQLCARGEIPAEYRARWMVQAVDGVTYLASLGLVHRDIKPANCLLDGAGNLRLADLGTARSLSHTMYATVAGSPLYMAPEIKLDGTPATYGPGVDVWSLGMLLLELLLSRPHEPDARATHIYGASRSPSWPEFLARETESLPPDLAAFLAHCLKVTPSERLAPSALASHPAVRAWRLCFGLDAPDAPPAPPELLAAPDLLPPLFYALEAQTPAVCAWACRLAALAHRHNPLLPGYLAMPRLRARLTSLATPEAAALQAVLAGGEAPSLAPLTASFAATARAVAPVLPEVRTTVWSCGAGIPAESARLLDLVSQQGLPVAAVLALEAGELVAYDLARAQRVLLASNTRQALSAAEATRPQVPIRPAAATWRVRSGDEGWEYLGAAEGRALELLYRARALGVMLGPRLLRFDTGLGLDTRNAAVLAVQRQP